MRRLATWGFGLLVAMLATALAGDALLAAETDQYWAWGRPLGDSTDAVNARFNLELERAIASFPDVRPPETCREVAVAYRKRLRFLLLHEIQIWAWNSKWVARIPDGAAEQREYRRTNLYSEHPTIDTGTWMPFTPTIDVGGVRFGTDKLAHVVSSGWTYYGVYRRALRKGATPEEAERKAVRRGILEESLVLGGLTSGVKSVADVEASHAGMHFYDDLCDGDDPVLRRDGRAWVVARAIDLRAYVTPRWDESFQPPIYSKKRWRRVRPVMEGYCDRLSDPWVVEQRRRYRERDGDSLVMELIGEQVAAGKIEDPARFGLDAVCAEPGPSAEAVDGAVALEVAPEDPVAPETWRQRLVEEDEDRRRFALGLIGAQLTYPQVVTASLAVMPTSQPRSYDCRTPCDHRGPFVQIRPGLGGGSLSVGWGRVTGNTNRSGTLLESTFVGLLYKLTLLRTWGDHGGLDANRTYAGPEVALPVGRANLALGLLHRVDDGPGRTWLVTGSVGWGF
jgi:hypothetical protein